MLLPFCVVILDVVMEVMIEGMLTEWLYVNDLVSTSKTIEGLGNKFIRWRNFFRTSV